MRQMSEMVEAQQPFSDYADELLRDALGLEERLSRMTRKQRRALGAKLRKELRQQKKNAARSKG